MLIIIIIIIMIIMIIMIIIIIIIMIIIDVYTRLKKIKMGGGGYKQLKGTKRFRQVCHHQG